MSSQDLLIRLALEHRDLTRATRELRRGLTADRERLDDTAVAIVEHELAHRLLVHPVLRRDRRGRQLFDERREEQLLLADRLRHALLAADTTVPQGAGSSRAAVRGLDDQLVEHTDREEIVSFPHVRRLARAGELVELVAVRERIRDGVLDRLRTDDSLVRGRRWATTRRRQLPGLLGLAEDLVIVLPDLEGKPTTTA